MRENTDQKNLRIGQFSHSESSFLLCFLSNHMSEIKFLKGNQRITKRKIGDSFTKKEISCGTKEITF